MYSILKCVILKIILQDTNYKMMSLNDKEKSIKVEFIRLLNCEIPATKSVIQFKSD